MDEKKPSLNKEKSPEKASDKTVGKASKKAMGKNPSSKNISRINLIVYLLLVVGVFFLLYRYPLRLDLTRTNAFTLSDASKDLVNNLNDPVRIKAFVSENLPAPLNEVEINLQDILAEYNSIAGDKFTYSILKIDEKKEGQSAEVEENIKQARDYGIAPQQVQTFDKDEVKLVRAYLGLVIEYGNAQERIPFLNNNNSLEYLITELISRLTRKNDKLIGLKENIDLTLYLNKDFVLAAQYFGIQGVPNLEANVRNTVDQANKDNFNKINFRVVDVISPEEESFLRENDVRNLAWEEFTVPNVGSFPKGVGYAALTISLGDKLEVLELIQVGSSLQLTSEGLQALPTYQLVDTGEGLKENINGSIESILEVNQRIAYLDQKGTVPVVNLNAFPGGNLLGGNQAAEGENFYRSLSKTYQVETVNLEELGSKYNSLIVAGPKESFNDYELFLIDQFIMQGKSVTFFQDSFTVESPNPQVPPQVQENENNLDKLLEHYGIDVGKSMIFDEMSFVQRQQNASGGVEEFKIYFAPIIQNFNNSFPVLRNIKEVVSLQNSPVSLNQDNLENHKNTKTTRLYSSSAESWALSENISLIPQSIIPPQDPGRFKSFDLAYIVEAEFNSFFADKEIPAKPEEDLHSLDDGHGHSHDEVEELNRAIEERRKQAEASRNKGEYVANFNEDEVEKVITEGRPAKIMVLGSSQVIKNNIFSQDDQNVNSVYILNLIDYMNDREDWGIMRGKGRYSNPLEPFDANASAFKRLLTNRDFIKFFNMVGLPILIVLLGFIAYALRKKRVSSISHRFNP